MSLFSNIKKLLNVDKGSDHQAPDGQEAFQTLPKHAGGTVVRQEKEPQLTTLEMARQGAWAVKSATAYSTGDLIGNRYRVEAVFSGAMGYVYISRDTSQRIMFAIKQPKEEMLANRELFSRVLQEADAWTKLGMHPNIAYCYFVRAIEGVPHIFIEYVDGGSLEDWISDRRCADYKVGIDMAIQFCHGLERAHDRGMIHRDIKPRNVLVTKGGQVKVTDFGLVGGGKAGGKVSAVQGDMHGTRLGDTMGTPAYMPPEQWNDPRQKSETVRQGVWYDSDVYSFGVCMWEMFCGRRPYEVSIGVKGGPPDPRDLKRDLPNGLRELLLRSIELDRGKRYKNFRRLKEKLNEVYRELYGSDAPHYKLELHDTTADELNNQGYSYHELGRKEEARRCFDEAVKIDITHPEAVFNLALLQWRESKINEPEALKRIRNCLNSPAVDKEKIAELLAYIHAERFDLAYAKEQLKEYPGRFDELFGSRTIGTIGLARTFEGHSDSVKSVSLSADCRYALSGSYDKTLKLWEVETGKCVRTLQGHRFSVHSVSLSADSRLALSGSRDKSLKLWEVETGKCLRTFEGHSDSVLSVSLSADDRHALSGSGDKTLKLWEVETGKCLRTFESHSDSVSSVSLSADGRYALSGSGDKTLKLWEVETGKCLRTFKGHSESVESVSLSADGRYALSGSGTTLKLWEVETGKCVRTFKGHSGSVKSVSLSADGRYALSGNWDKTIEIWGVETGKCLRTFEGHSDRVQSVSLSADGRYALSGSEDKTLKLWEININAAYTSELQVTGFKNFEEIKEMQDELRLAVEEAKRLMKKRKHSRAFAILYGAWEEADFRDNDELLRVYQRLYSISSKKIFSFGYLKNTFEGHTRKVRSVSLSADSRHALSGSGDKTLKKWEVETGKCLRTFKGHSESVESVNLNANSTYALSGGDDNKMKLWDAETGKCLRTFDGHYATVKCVDLSIDYKHALSGGNDETLKLWDVETGTCLCTFEGHSNSVNSVSLSVDGKYAFSGSNDKTLKLWEVETGKCLRTFEGHSGLVRAISLTADGRYALSASWDNTLKLWKIETGKCLRTFEGHSESVNSISLSADGRHALSGSVDNTLKLWEVATGKCLHTFEGHIGSVDSVSLSADGRYALSGSEDKTLKLWRLIWKLEFDEEQ